MGTQKLRHTSNQIPNTCKQIKYTFTLMNQVAHEFIVQTMNERQLKSLETLGALEALLKSMLKEGVSLHGLDIHVKLLDESHCRPHSSAGSFVADNGSVHLMIGKGTSR